MAASSSSSAAAAAASAPPAAAAAAVVVFTTPACPYCKRAKAALSGVGAAFDEVDVSGDAALRAALAEAANGVRTVPQVFVNGELVGGSDDVAAAIDSGRLARLLAAPPKPAGERVPAALAAAVAAAAASAAAASSSAGPPAPSQQQLPPELERLRAALADPSSGVVRSSSSSDGTFTGAALLDWLSRYSGGGGDGADGTVGRPAAAPAALGAQLLAANVVTRVAAALPAVADVAAVDAGATYRLRPAVPPRARVPWGSPLNAAWWWGPSPPRRADAVAEDLRRRIVALYDRHLSADGRAVSYKGLAQDPDFWAYADAAHELQRVDLGELSRAELLAFGTNVYNALCVHALVAGDGARRRYATTLGRSEFFKRGASYVVGGHAYALDDVENGVLRGNRPGAASLGMLLGLPWLSRGPFGAGDPRARHVVGGPVDARLHFALVCGAKSCPPIKVFSAAALDEGLQGAAEAFAASDVAVDAPRRAVRLSKIFGWYAPDFGATKAARLRFLLPLLPSGPRGALEAMLRDDPDARGIRVEYAPYDWGLNAAPGDDDDDGGGS